jgi:hypothetical protein
MSRTTSCETENSARYVFTIFNTKASSAAPQYAKRLKPKVIDAPQQKWVSRRSVANRMQNRTETPQKLPNVDTNCA